jgi:carbonyl reductase 1
MALTRELSDSLGSTCPSTQATQLTEPALLSCSHNRFCAPHPLFVIHCNIRRACYKLATELIVLPLSALNMISSTAGRIAVVTGANKGIGYFIAMQLALSGLFESVIIACRDATRAADAVKALQAKVPDTVKIIPESLTVGDTESHIAFVSKMDSTYGKVDCLVNNAAIAFKGSDPTPFKDQCKPTLDINFRGTVDFTERMIPLLEKGTDPRLVSVASMAARLRQLSPELQAKFSSPQLTIPELKELVDKFEADVQEGKHIEQGWGKSNYGLSKLSVVAATKVWAREHPKIKVNCCCPGYCKTDMSSNQGGRDPADGARNAVIPATMENPPTGEFFEDYKVSQW